MSPILTTPVSFNNLIIKPAMAGIKKNRTMTTSLIIIDFFFFGNSSSKLPDNTIFEISIPINIITNAGTIICKALNMFASKVKVLFPNSLHTSSLDGFDALSFLLPIYCKTRHDFPSFLFLHSYSLVET